MNPLRALRQQLLASFRAAWRRFLERPAKPPRIRVRPDKERFDERSSMDRFRRESGQR